MPRRRFRTKGFRRKARVHWIDTFQDGVPILMDIFPGFDTDPTHNKVLVVPLIRQRTPQAVEDISSVLEGKDEGFRLRRIVGDLLFIAGHHQAEEVAAANYPGGIRFYVTWGIMVHPITSARNFDNFANNQYVFNPTESVSMSDPWLIRKSIALVGYPNNNEGTGPDRGGIRFTNQNDTPDGTFVDVTVNRRVGPEEDVSLFMCWNTAVSPFPGLPLQEPFYKENLRILISR